MSFILARVACNNDKQSLKLPNRSLTGWRCVSKIQPNIDTEHSLMQITRFFAPYYYYGTRFPAAVGGA
jgi:hypothetical protein